MIELAGHRTDGQVRIDHAVVGEALPYADHVFVKVVTTNTAALRDAWS
jgi:hypothetical protein